ncbi:MAG: ABC transporter ATP-binding protein/permease [Alphaproteobacteria bacterium]|nr:ABC transporter ATP-binding protein/permease [Alphaproteobacteria bacterium]
MSAQNLQPVDYIPTTPTSLLWLMLRKFYAWRCLSLVVVVLIAQFFQTIDAYIFKELINSLTQLLKDPNFISTTVYWFWMCVVVWFASTLGFRVYDWIDLYTSPKLREQIQNQMFGYLLGHSPQFFQDNFAGKLGQKVKEAGRSSIEILELLITGTRIIFMTIVTLILMATEHSLYAIILGTWMVAYLGCCVYWAKGCIVRSESLFAQVSLTSGKIIDSIANAESVRSFARWRHERHKIQDVLGEERRRSMNFRWFLIYMKVFQAVLILSMLSGITYLAIVHVRQGIMDLGGFSMVFSLANIVTFNVWNLSNDMLSFFEHVGTLKESLNLITKPHAITNVKNAPLLKVTQGEIIFDNITYQHPDGSILFDQLNLKIDAGQKIGLVGPSGAGKSTLVKLLRRHFEPSSGSIYIDGQNVAKVNWDSVNENIAEVSQNPGIFHRPVFENIQFGNLNATADEVEHAACQAYCHDFIMQRPQGYQTIVGEQGIKLSGGERQRIAIARAFLKNAPILILDEATSALDSESEHFIQQALNQLMAKRTVIAIAHRLSTITHMDQILYLKKGQIIERGSHQELLELNGYYARMWNKQVGGFIQEET